jgi:hypothetical protein
MLKQGDVAVRERSSMTGTDMKSSRWSADALAMSQTHLILMKRRDSATPSQLLCFCLTMEMSWKNIGTIRADERLEGRAASPVSPDVSDMSNLLEALRQVSSGQHQRPAHLVKSVEKRLRGGLERTRMKIAGRSCALKGRAATRLA